LVRLDGFVWQFRPELFEALEILDSAAVEALGLGLVAEQQRKTVGLARELMETGAEQEIPVLGAGDFDIAAEDGAVHVDPGMAIGVAGFVEGGGEEASFEAGSTEEGLLGEGDAFEGEELLRVDGLVDGHEVGLEAGDFVDSSKRTTAKVEARKPCFRAFWAERALPSGVRGPVERWALARLAARRRGEAGLRVLGME
jgi:hypothetical protein